MAICVDNLWEEITNDAVVAAPMPFVNGDPQMANWVHSTAYRTVLFISLLVTCLGKVVRDDNKVTKSFVEWFMNAVCSHWWGGNRLHQFMSAYIIRA